LKKSKKFRPDYQVANGGTDGVLYKPWKLLALPEGGFICLMHEILLDTWLVFSLDTHGVAARSNIYQMKSVAAVMWRELCRELVEPDEDAIKDKLLSGKLTGRQRADAVMELGRLELCDDELSEGIRAQAEQFVESQSPEECDAYIQKELRAYDERRASGGDEEELP